MNNTFSWKTIGQSLIAALMAASSSQVILAAAGLGGGSVGVWCAALAVAALWAMSGVHHRLRLAGKLAALAAAVAIVCAQAGRIGDVRAWAAAAMNGEAAEASVIRGACLALSAVLPAVFCLIYGWFLNSFSDAVLPLTVFLPVLVFSYAATPGLSVWPAVPGLMAALTAFVSGGFPKWDRSFWLTAGASALVVLLAALFLPARAPVSGPLENAAGTARRMFEDYFRFNEERVPFTISTEGYNHAVQAEGGVEARLGGPASPSEETVMEVRASQPLLLRGAVRRTYTGNAWVDPDAKARYLFFDVFRRSLRDRLFCMHDNGAFDRVPAEVRFLADGPSALFVPSRMDGLSMDLRTAVYFNSIGEIFLSRTVRAGDAYSLTARTAPEGDEAVRRAVLEAAGRDDRTYAANTGNCLQLPEGIDPEVYRLAASITDGAENDYDRAAAIASWLRSNIRYTLTPSYPDDSRDFVSQVLLGSREGYCSYYATAMAVLCRMSGMPARYVEGYSVKPEADGTALVTGRNAHAWCEVYFPNVGWIAFDPTGGSGDGAGNGGSGGSGGGAGGSEEGLSSPDDQATLPPQAGATPPPASEPSGSPDSADGTEPPSGGEDGANAPDAPTPPEPPRKRGHARVWLLLLILLLLAALASAALLRLRATDPLRLCSREGIGRERAALILYRSILTLLKARGEEPGHTETPSAFARRLAAGKNDPAFARFAVAVDGLAYADRPVSDAALNAGRKAYERFRAGLTVPQRLRWLWVRLFSGLGSFENIP